MHKLRDELFKSFGTDFQSSFSSHGSLAFNLPLTFPLDREETTIYEDFFFRLKDDFGFIMLLDLTLETDGSKKSLVYQFLNLEVYFRLQVRVDIGEGQFFASLASLYPSAQAFEEDICQHEDIYISNGLKSQQRVLLAQGKKKVKIKELPKYELPLRPESEASEKKWQRFGPYESPFKGKARVDFLHGNGKVFDIEMERGLHFRNFEKQTLKKDFFHLTFLFERLSLKDCVFAPLLWVETMEERLKIEVPDKARALRMVWMELARSENHLLFLWELTHDLGFFAEASVFAELLEQIYHLYNLYAGKTQNFPLFNFGGMVKAAPLGWGTETLEAAKYIFKVLEDVDGELHRNSRWMKETQDFPMSATTAIELGITGPNLRACGVNFDSRKSRPRYFYDDVEFEVPLGIDGTTYDRFLVRLHELKQSLRIINQVLDHLPAGDYLNKNHVLYNPLLEKRGVDFENGFSGAQEAFRKEESFTMVESSEGQLGLYLKTDESGLKHLHIRSSSLVHFYSYPTLVRGGSINGALTAFQSLNIDPWEMDR
ncbi:MAG: hypothetical protein VXV96_06420 [Bdellovibrionota bacterium]|nr:hypothetical protein [Bdellovibrionota bacterium]